MRGRLGAHHNIAAAAADATIWWPALLVATWLRYEFSLPVGFWTGWVVVAITASCFQLLVGIGTGLYRGRWRFGAIEEAGATASTVIMTDLAVIGSNRFLLGHQLPVSSTVLAGPLALIAMVAARYLWRSRHEWQVRQNRSDDVSLERVIVFGAGSGGRQVIQAMLSDRHSPFLPVALLDDSPQYRNLRVKGIPVRGTRARMLDVAQQHRATKLIVAIPSADAELIREVAAQARDCGLAPLVLPPVGSLFGRIGISDIRPLSPADLLGRREIEIDMESTAAMLTRKRVLVTGAGGSIGAELCRQIRNFGPSELIMVDHDDSALHGLELSMTGRALGQDENLVLADVRDADRIRSVFEQFQPQVVFHAAALKHLSALEANPEEGFKTNVIGSANVIDAARRERVQTFVNISTDKAANPVSVLGKTKRIAERLIAAAAGVDEHGSYVSVRFGNVLGSRGSVLPTLRSQIAAGGPVTITHPDVTRYFMTVEEAVRLVLCAAAIGSSGETLVLDMGKPVRIDDVARQLIAEAERPIDITYTGLRPGEKLHERLLDENASDFRPRHPLISHTRVEPLSSKVSEMVDFGTALGMGSGGAVGDDLADLRRIES